MVEPDRAQHFIRESEKAQRGLLRESWAWLRHNKKWWLLPPLLAQVLVGFLVVLSETAVGPVIYTLF